MRTLACAATALIAEPAGARSTRCQAPAHAVVAKASAGIVVYRLDDRLFFANARYVKARIREAVRAAPSATSWLVFDAVAVTHVDTTGIEALEDVTNDLRGDGLPGVFFR